MSWSIRLAFACEPLGILSRTFEALWTQHLCSLVVPHTWRIAFQNPKAPSPIASDGSTSRPRAWTSSSSSFHDCSLSR
jgi:hypothetical protein